MIQYKNIAPHLDRYEKFIKKMLHWIRPDKMHSES